VAAQFETSDWARSDPTSAAARNEPAASLARNEKSLAEDAYHDHGWSIAEFLRDNPLQMSYIIIVRQVVIDKGADIGPISFYPYEMEILFGAIVMMEWINVRIEGDVIVLEVRLNVNALAGTLDDIMNEKSRSIASTTAIFLHELQVKDSIKKLKP
jgi:hypothetical protein